MGVSVGMGVSGISTPGVCSRGIGGFRDIISKYGSGSWTEVLIGIGVWVGVVGISRSRDEGIGRSREEGSGLGPWSGFGRSDWEGCR